MLSKITYLAHVIGSRSNACAFHTDEIANHCPFKGRRCSLTSGNSATLMPPCLSIFRAEDNVQITSGSRSSTANGTDNRSE